MARQQRHVGKVANLVYGKLLTQRVQIGIQHMKGKVIDGGRGCIAATIWQSTTLLVLPCIVGSTSVELSGIAVRLKPDLQETIRLRKCNSTRSFQ